MSATEALSFSTGYRVTLYRKIEQRSKSDIRWVEFDKTTHADNRTPADDSNTASVPFTYLVLQIRFHQLTVQLPFPILILASQTSFRLQRDINAVVVA